VVTWAGKAEALLQAFGMSVGSCGLANVLMSMGRIFNNINLAMGVAERGED